MRSVIIWLIRLYQRTLSLDHGLLRFLYPHGYCKFYPTCSEYGAQAFTRHGVLRGAQLTLSRILRCHPFSKGGIDEVPLFLSGSKGRG